MKYQGNSKLEEYHKKYRLEHREEKNAWMREYIKRPKIQARRKQYTKQYWKKNKGKLAERSAEYFQTHKENFRKYGAKYRNSKRGKTIMKKYHQTVWKETLLKRKIETMEHYSGKPAHCQICGELELKFLTIDHINGRSLVGHNRSMTGERIVRWLIKNQYPKGFQVLCFNCNCAKKFVYGLKQEPKIKNRRDRYYFRIRNEEELIKKEVLKHYADNISPKCMCCNKDKLEWLTIDHLDRQNSKHPQNQKTAGRRLYRWLLNNDYPKGYQTLCYSCNFAKGKYGKCPHQTKML